MKPFKEVNGKWEPVDLPKPSFEKKKNKKAKKRWDDLHELSIVKKEAMRKIKEDMISKDEMDLMKCTFQPKILKKSEKLEKDFLERNKDWIKEKLKKQEETIQYKIDKNEHHCTFKPALVKKNPDFTQDDVFLKSKVVDFVEKQKTARNLKGEINVKNHYLDKHFKKNVVDNAELKKLQNRRFGDNVMKLHQKFLDIEIVF